MQALQGLWNTHARTPGTLFALYKAKEPDGRLDDPRALHNVFVMEDIAAGAKRGFVLPVAGDDGQWMRENMGEFERRAALGDDCMRELVEWVKSRL